MDDIKEFPFTTLVASGGGIKGFQHLGALHCLFRRVPREQFRRYVGSSIGAIVLFLISLGYTPIELLASFYHTDFATLDLEFNFMRLINSFGMNTQESIAAHIETLMREKGVDARYTMREHFERTNIEFVVTVTNLSTFKGEVVTPASHPDLPVLTALRMTSALPLFFEPVRYNDHLYIDGGIFNNYPIELYPDSFGLLIVDIDRDTPHTPQNLVSYLYRLFNYTVFQNVYEKYPRYGERTVLFLNTNRYTPVSFWLQPDQKMELFRNGYRHTRAFLRKAFRID